MTLNDISNVRVATRVLYSLVFMFPSVRPYIFLFFLYFQSKRSFKIFSLFEDIIALSNRVPILETVDVKFHMYKLIIDRPTD